jgi:hypothetical protein
MTRLSRTGAPRMILAAIPAAVMLFALSQGASAQALADQSVEERLNTLMRVIGEQQKQINSLEQQVTNLEMSQRGRGMPGVGAPADSAAVAEQPGADGLPVPLPPLAQVNPGTPAPGGGTGTATGVPVTPPVAADCRPPPMGPARSARARKKRSPCARNRKTPWSRASSTRRCSTTS